MSSFCWAVSDDNPFIEPTFAIAASSAATVVVVATFMTLFFTLAVWQPAQKLV